MKNPQTTAEKLFDYFPECVKLRNIKKYGCAAFTAIWCIGLDPDDVDAIGLVSSEIGRSLDDECTVTWCDFAHNLTGRNYTVEFRDIKKLSDLKDIKERCAVFYSIDGKSGHWVGVEKMKIGFNSLKYSNNVQNGKPIKRRILRIKK